MPNSPPNDSQLRQRGGGHSQTVPHAGDAFLRSIFEHSPVAFSCHRILLDDGGRPADYVFLEVNPAFERLTGLSRAALVGKRVTEAIPGIERDPADWIGTYGEVALTGRKIAFRQFSENLQRWYDVTAYAPEQGYFVAIFSDCTEHLALESALREREAAYRAQYRRLQAVLNATHAQLALLDDQLRFVMVNDAYERACGHRRDELIGRGHFEFFPDADNERIFHRVAETGQPFYVNEKPFEYADQPERGVTYWNWSLVPIKSDSGAVQGVLLSLLDVSAQVRARRDVEQLAAERQRAIESLGDEVRLRERLVAILSHDLRTPLSTVLSGLRLLERKRTAADDAGTIQRAERAVASMQSLTASLLDYSRLRAGQGIPVDVRTCDLGEIARRVVEDHRATSPGRTLALDCQGDLRGVWDPERIGQLLANLVGNAVKYGAPNTDVRVSVRAQAEHVEIEVHNDGEPIPPEVLPTLFTAFQRGSREATAGRPGLGLGLHIVAEIARAHGGAVRAHSTRAEGTSFWVVLPRND